MTISLTDSVGFEGKNKRADVEAVQIAHKEAAHLTLDNRLDPGIVDGLAGVGTDGAIERFQRRLGISKPDARIDPGGYTFRRINA